MTTTQEVVNHHLDCFGKGDIEGLLSDYTNDSILVTPMGTMDNLPALREGFGQLVAEFGQDGVTFEMGDVHIADDVAMVTWSADTPNNTYHFATDTFLIRNGKIERQTFTAHVTPK